jgi:hypothetical protein
LQASVWPDEECAIGDSIARAALTSRRRTPPVTLSPRPVRRDASRRRRKRFPQIDRA